MNKIIKFITIAVVTSSIWACYSDGSKRDSDSSSVSGDNRSSTQFVEPEMVFVQGGTFWMGSKDDNRANCRDRDYEQPAHKVRLSDFYIGKYEVTQAQWESLMGSNPSKFKGANLPVEQVSWNDAQKFIKRLNAATGKQYRLPTEAEWEYAARGGTQSKAYEYSGSNSVYEVAWCFNNSGNKTHPAGTKSANELGIYDMSGNVWEWCYDWYGCYQALPQHNPAGASSGSGRVVRGGSWDADGECYCHVASRSGNSLGNSYNILGFRLALSSE